MTLQNFIIQYREDHKLSQREFAKQCGLTNGYISMLESGENPKTGKPIIPKIDAIVRIASGTNMTIDELFEIIDDTIFEIKGELLHYKSLLGAAGYLNKHENQIIVAYRDQPEVQPEVDTILGIQEKAPSKGGAILSVAARGPAVTDEEFDALISEEDTLESPTE